MFVDVNQTAKDSTRLSACLGREVPEIVCSDGTSLKNWGEPAECDSLLKVGCMGTVLVMSEASYLDSGDEAISVDTHTHTYSYKGCSQTKNPRIRDFLTSRTIWPQGEFIHTRTQSRTNLSTLKFGQTNGTVTVCHITNRRWELRMSALCGHSTGLPGGNRKP